MEHDVQYLGIHLEAKTNEAEDVDAEAEVDRGKDRDAELNNTIKSLMSAAKPRE